MALTQFAFVAVGVGFGATNIPVPIASNVTSESVVPDGTNAQTTIVAPTGIAEVMCRVATDTAVYVAFGANPDASDPEACFLIPSNGVEYFRVNVGDKAAVVTA